MNGYSSPQMMVAKLKQRKTFLCDNLGFLLRIRTVPGGSNANFNGI